MYISNSVSNFHHFSRETIIFMTDPAFDSTVSASTNEILVKSTPSTSKILSLTLSLPYADDWFSTSLINMPCVNEIKWHQNEYKNYFMIKFKSKNLKMSIESNLPDCNVW